MYAKSESATNGIGYNVNRAYPGAVPRSIREALTSWDHKVNYPMPKMTGGAGAGAFCKTYELGVAPPFFSPLLLTHLRQYLSDLRAK